MFLQPRLNYHFTLYDTWKALTAVLKKNDRRNGMSSLYVNSQIFYTNMGRTALRLILNSLNLPKNAKIGVQIYNCHSVFAAIKQAGYLPVFIDIDRSLTIDLNDLKKKIHDIDALIVTHTFGIPAKIMEIIFITGKIPIIEDVAHGFLSKINEKHLGTFGDAAIFSFGNAKFPASGEGGVAMINNKAYLSKFEEQYSELRELSKPKQIFNILKTYGYSLMMLPPIYSLITYNLKKWYANKNAFKYLSIEENICSRGFKFIIENRLHQITEYQIRQLMNVKFLIAGLNEKYKVISTSIVNPINYFLLPVLTSSPLTLIKKGHLNGIELGQQFSESNQWAEYYGYINGECPNFELLKDQIVTIPCHYRLSTNTLNRLIITLS